MSGMRKVLVNQDATEIVVEGGCLLHDLDRALAPRGKCVPTGLVSETVLSTSSNFYC